MSSILLDVVLNALGLIALAYGTFAVVSFLEIRDKYQSDPELLRDDYREASAGKTGRAAESVSPEGRPVSLDDLGAKATTGKKNKKKGRGRKQQKAKAVLAQRTLVVSHRVSARRFL